MINRSILLRYGGVMIAVIVLSALGCGGGGGGTSYDTDSGILVQLVTCPASPGATINAVSSTNFAPSSVTISANQIVQWNNATGFDHTVTSTSVPTGGTFNVALNNGTSVCLRFTAAGTYTYRCTPHPNMTGVVAVQ